MQPGGRGSVASAMSADKMRFLKLLSSDRKDFSMRAERMTLYINRAFVAQFCEKFV